MVLHRSRVPVCRLDSQMHVHTDQPAQHDACIVCGSWQLTVLPRHAAAHLVRCVGCGLIFARRRPSDEDLAGHYLNYGTAWYDSPVTRQRFDELLRSFEPYRRFNRILEVGCGAGFFLEEARRRGWEVYGSEYSARALELSRAKGFAVVQAPTTDDTFEPGFFDVIAAFEVVEHLRDPTAEAKVIAHGLRHGGLFYCTTPNFNALSRRLLGPRWEVISYPEHLCYFTSASLSGWLGRVGLVPKTVTSTGFSPAAVRSGIAPDTRSSEPGQSLDERLRIASDRSRFLGQVKAAVNAVLSGVGAGDTLKGRFEMIGTAHLS